MLLNEKLTTELRPTLFLAQLSNLVAGNISIVHKVTGSSRTFMGEEAAGISAVETAFHRIKAGQSTHSLVGGAFVAERADILLLVEGIRAHATGDWHPLWGRSADNGGGMIMGSVGAFLVLESRAHAEARGAHIYAVIDAIEGDRGNRDEGRLESAFPVSPAMPRAFPRPIRWSFRAPAASSIWPRAKRHCWKRNSPAPPSAVSAASPATAWKHSSPSVWRLPH